MRASGSAPRGPRGGVGVDVASTTLPAALSSGRVARRFVSTTLARWQAEAVADVALLLTSELVTNAVLHARSSVELRIERTSEVLRFEVADVGPGAPTMRQPELEDQSGRGLQLVDAMSRCWGVTAARHGKSVWFELIAE
ncbi:MAG: response regulator receiver [Acidimicrobiales bacterium]|nr:response regulator receiver [Acidimicrobiales bacterium]